MRPVVPGRSCEIPRQSRPTPHGVSLGVDDFTVGRKAGRDRVGVLPSIRRLECLGRLADRLLVLLLCCRNPCCRCGPFLGFCDAGSQPRSAPKESVPISKSILRLAYVIAYSHQAHREMMRRLRRCRRLIVRSPTEGNHGSRLNRRRTFAVICETARSTRSELGQQIEPAEKTAPPLPVS